MAELVVDILALGVVAGLDVVLHPLFHHGDNLIDCLLGFHPEVILLKGFNNK